MRKLNLACGRGGSRTGLNGGGKKRLGLQMGGDGGGRWRMVVGVDLGFERMMMGIRLGRSGLHRVKI